MNFTFLPSSSVLIHSSSGIFVSLQARSGYREYTLFAARNRAWGMKSYLLRIWHSNRARRTTTENCPCRASLCSNEQLLNRLTEDGGREENVLDLPLCCLHQPNNNLSYGI